MREYKLTRPVINGEKSRVWYVSWREGRSRRASTQTENKAEAQRFLAAFRAAQERPPEEYSINELAEAYVTDRIRDGISHPENMRGALKPILAFMGDIHPNSITRTLCLDYVDHRRGEGLSDSTINKEARFLRQALTWGQRNEWDMRSDIHIPAPPQGPARRRFLSEGEFSALVESAETPHMRVFLSLGVWTAARSGAILGLQWRDVSFDNRIVFYPAEKAGSKKRTRPVPINDPLLKELQLAQRISRTNHVIEWRGKQVQSIRKAFTRTAERAGVKDVRIHDLRRTSASWALQRGASFAEVAALLGDSEQIVRKHYAHFSPNYLAKVTDLLAAHNAPLGGTKTE